MDQSNQVQCKGYSAGSFSDIGVQDMFPSFEECLAMEAARERRNKYPALSNLSPDECLKLLLDINEKLREILFGDNNENISAANSSCDSLCVTSNDRGGKCDINETIETLLAQCKHPLPYEEIFPMKVVKLSENDVKCPEVPLFSHIVSHPSQNIPSAPISRSELPLHEIIINIPQTNIPRPLVAPSRPSKKRAPPPKPRSMPSKAQQACSKRRMAAIMADIPNGMKRSRMRAGSTPVKPPPRKRIV